MKTLSLLLGLACLPLATAQEPTPQPTAQPTPPPAAATPAQPAAAPAPAPVPTPPPDELVLEAGTTRLKDLIDRTAAVLRANILVTEQELANGPRQDSGIALQQRLVVPAAACEAVVSNLLFTQGFALTVLDEERRLYEVLNLSGHRGRLVADRAQLRTPEQLAGAPPSKMFVTTMVALQHSPANLVNNMLRPFLASSGAPAGQINLGMAGPMTLVVTGTQDQVVATLRIVKAGDQPEPAPSNDVLARLERIENRLAALEGQRGKK